MGMLRFGQLITVDSQVTLTYIYFQLRVSKIYRTVLTGRGGGGQKDRPYNCQERLVN